MRILRVSQLIVFLGTWFCDPHERSTRSMVVEALSATTNPSSGRRPSLLLTFDLDDTLFPVVPAVRDANVAMFESLSTFGYGDATEDGYLEACREIRRESGGVPMTYSELRRSALRREMKRVGKSDDDDDDDESIPRSAEVAFDAWLAERHASAERNLFPEVLPALAAVRERYGDSLVVGAVTNGRGDPADMKRTLRPFFDFCVSGEDDDVFPERKPHAGIYRATLEKAKRVRREDEGGDFHCWMHVGDDLANDVGASSDCGARAVWFDVDAYVRNKDDGEVGDKSSFVTTASSEEKEKRRILRERAVTKVTAKIESMAELPSVMESILLELSSSAVNVNVFEKSR